MSPSELRAAVPVSFVVSAAASVLALVSGLSACGSGAQCALDSDCALGLRCNTQHQCVARGNGDVDAAVPRDTGPRADTGPADDAFAAMDAPVTPDAFVELDAPMDDANDDADLDAFDDCPVLGMSYTVTRSGIACMSNATTVAFMRLAGSCAYQVSSDRRADVEGVMTYAPGTGFSGGLNFPDVGRSCTLDLIADQVVIACGSCTIELAPTP